MVYLFELTSLHNVIPCESMSLYNGFLNNNEQGKYYHLIKTLVLVLQKRVLRFYQRRPCNEEKFISIIYKIITKIAKMEQGKYMEPKFSDSLEQLFEQLHVEKSTRLQRFNTESELTLNFDDRFSQASFDQDIESLCKKKSSITPFKLESIDTLRLKDSRKYHSFENVRMKPIIDEKEEWSKNKISRSRIGEVRNIKARLQPPKVSQYIEKIKKDSMMADYPKRERQRKKSGEAYLGQRRHRQKKIVRTITNH